MKKNIYVKKLYVSEVTFPATDAVFEAVSGETFDTLAPEPNPVDRCAGSVVRTLMIIALPRKPPPQLNNLKLQRNLLALPKRNRREQVLTLSPVQISVCHKNFILFRKATDISTFVAAVLNINLVAHKTSRNNTPTKHLSTILHQKAIVNRWGKILSKNWLN